MPAVWMYNAALICGPCADKVKEDLKTAAGWSFDEDAGTWRFVPVDGKGAAMVFDSDGYVLDGSGRQIGTDTDTFPSDCSGLSSESDYVEFCDSGADCLEAFKPPYVPGGPAAWPIGVWLENDLTGDGIESLKAEIKARPRNPVVAFSRHAYADVLRWS